MNVIGKALILCVVGLFSGAIAYAATPDISGIVLLGTTSDAPRNQLKVGFVADDKGHIIASINTTNERLIVTAADGVTYMADKISYDEVSKLALLKVNTDFKNLKPYTFAHDAAKPQRKVFGIKVENNLTQSQVLAGTLAKIQLSDKNQGLSYYLHNALVGENNQGGPLFNNCAEVVGVIITPQQGLWADLFSGKEEDTAYAVPITWLLNQFKALGIQPVSATASCLSETEQAIQAKKAAEAEQTKLEKEAAEAKEKANQAKKEADQALKDKKATEAEKAELEKKALQAKKAAKAKQDELEKNTLQLKEIIIRLEKAVKRESDLKKAANEALATAEGKKRQYLMWGIIGVTVLLLLLLLVWILKQRTVNRERREKDEAKSSLAAQAADKVRIAQTPTVFFEGTDVAGQTVALRIPGASIATANGATVGRNPSDSDFVINHPEVSRKQFRLFRKDYLLMIEDLGSTNGSIVNGKRLSMGQVTELLNQGHLELGKLKLSVRLEQN